MVEVKLSTIPTVPGCTPIVVSPDVDADLTAARLTVGEYRTALAALPDRPPTSAGEPVRVAVAGDWHGNTRWARSAIEMIPDGVGLLVHLGDFGIMGANFVGDYVRKVNRFAAARELTVWVVDGNHENHDWIARQSVDDAGLTVVASNIRVLPRGYRFMIGGLSVCAVGGAVSVDQASRTPGKSWWPQEELSDEQAWAIAADGPADVLLTHDMPSGSGCPGLSHQELLDWAGEAVVATAYAHHRRVRGVAEALSCGLLLHGHLHTRYSNNVVWENAEGQEFDCTIHGLAADGNPGNLVVLTVVDSTISLTDVPVRGAR